MLILLTVCHTFHIFYLSLTDLQSFLGPVALFQDFPVLENASIKFQDFPGFPGPVRTLYLSISLTKLYRLLSRIIDNRFCQVTTMGHILIGSGANRQKHIRGTSKILS